MERLEKVSSIYVNISEKISDVNTELGESWS